MKQEIFELMQYLSRGELVDLKREAQRRINLKDERKKLSEYLWPDRQQKANDQQKTLK